MTQFFKTHRKKGWLALFLLVVGLALILFTAHDQFLYRQPIGRVLTVEETSRHKRTDEFKNVDYQMTQKLTVKVMNGRYKGKIVQVHNRYSASGALDQHYRVGQEGFLSQINHDRHGYSASLNGLKRDTILVFLLWLALSALILLLGSAGARAALSVVLNFGLILGAISVNLRLQASHVVLIFSLLAVIFTIVTLLLVFGANLQSLLAMVATLLSTFVSLGICLIVMALTNQKGIYYESMQYVTQNPRTLFIAEILLGSLGAVMDESSDVVATVFELKRVDQQAGFKKLFKAGMQVGKSVMGPLINVLLLIFFASTFTCALLYLKNGNSWGYTFDMSMCLGMVQSLAAGIGIVINVPLISTLIAYLLKGSDESVND